MTPASPRRGASPDSQPLFFAIAQGFGALGPIIYGAFVGDGTKHTPLFLGYLLGAGVMVVGGIIAWTLGVDAEGKSLEEVATPLSARTGSTRAQGAAKTGLDLDAAPGPLTDGS